MPAGSAIRTFQFQMSHVCHWVVGQCKHRCRLRTDDQSKILAKTPMMARGRGLGTRVRDHHQHRTLEIGPYQISVLERRHYHQVKTWDRFSILVVPRGGTGPKYQPCMGALCKFGCLFGCSCRQCASGIALLLFSAFLSNSYNSTSYSRAFSLVRVPFPLSKTELYNRTRRFRSACTVRVQ